jgi:hypothetical protein
VEGASVAEGGRGKFDDEEGTGCERTGSGAGS